MTERYVAAIDQGTASSRCLIFDRSGSIVSVAQKEHRHIYPKPGWVEHDPLELWVNVEEVAARAIADAQLRPSDLVALGIANQRETTVVWNRETGQPLHNAISWQDMRTDHLVRELNAQFGPEYFRSRSGLPATTYFSGPKLRWLLDNVRGSARARGERRGPVRDDRLVVDLAAHRSAPDRRHERQPHVDDEPADARLGRRAAGGARGAARDAARDPFLGRGLRRGPRHAGGGPGRRGAGRPAGGAVRAGMLRARRGQVHLRHRQLPADEHGRAPGRVRPAVC